MQSANQKGVKGLAWLRLLVRDFHIQYVHNPFQLFRRKSGLADADIFKHIKIQTNYCCTRCCSFCHYGLERKPTNIQIEESLFFRIIDQLASLSYSGRIGLFETNEPLTDKRLPQFLAYARERLPHAWLLLTTNGDLLNEEKLHVLFRLGLNRLYLNSYDETALVRNLQLLEKQSHSVKKKIRHINRVDQTQWTSRAGNVSQFKSEAVRAPCDMVYEVMYIKPSGKVFSCISDYYDVNEMGDLNHQTLLEVWHGENFRNLRRQLNSGNREQSPLCVQCDYPGFTNLPDVPWSWRFNSLVRKCRACLGLVAR